MSEQDTAGTTRQAYHEAIRVLGVVVNNLAFGVLARRAVEHALSDSKQLDSAAFGTLRGDDCATALPAETMIRHILANEMEGLLENELWDRVRHYLTLPTVNYVPNVPLQTRSRPRHS